MKKNFGIAFVTGRSSFQNVLRTYFNNWIEHDLIADKNVGLHLFVVYDVNYSGAARSDFRNIPREITSLLESVSFYGRGEIEAEKRRLIGSGLINAAEADLIFGGEYAGLRNAALHFANHRKMDRLLFLDDDEYPLAVVRKNNGDLSWFGQSIVRTHLKYREDADITNGLHCGYISPLPHVDLGGSLHIDDFRKFIELSATTSYRGKTLSERLSKTSESLTPMSALAAKRWQPKSRRSMARSLFRERISASIWNA